jgi:hypothetical protein
LLSSADATRGYVAGTSLVIATHGDVSRPLLALLAGAPPTPVEGKALQTAADRCLDGEKATTSLQGGSALPRLV